MRFWSRICKRVKFNQTKRGLNLVWFGLKILPAAALILFLTGQLINFDPTYALIDPAGYFIQAESNKSLNLIVEATPDGALTAAKDTVTVKSNIPTGFRLFLSTLDSTNTSQRLNKDGSSLATSYINPTTGSLDSPTPLTANTWGFAIKQDQENPHSSKFSKNYGIPMPNLDSKWAAVPKRGEEVTILRSNQIENQSGKSVEIYYGVKADSGLEEGEYSGNIVYTAISNISSLLSAALEGNYELEIEPNILNKLSGGENLKIRTSLFKRTNLKESGQDSVTEFSNFELGEIQIKVNEKICQNPSQLLNSGILELNCLAPEQDDSGKYPITVTIPKLGIEIKKEEAIEYSQRTFNEITKMQEMTQEICKAETTPNIGTSFFTLEHKKNKNFIPEADLIDTRDNKKYKVRKLADGNCWMSVNLDLTLNTAETLTPENTDISRNWKPLRNTQAYTTNEIWGSTDLSRSRKAAEGRGVYYNWNAATAGSGAYNDPMGKVASSSICPKGWKLPKTKGSGSAYMLYQYYNTAEAMRTNGARFTLDGHQGVDGTVVGEREFGYFWANQMIGDNGITVSVIRIDENTVSPDHADGLNYGFPIRCVVATDKEPNEISYMQEMDTKICEKMAQHQTLNLIDARDNESYTVAKLKNNACWMTKNLKFVLSRDKGLRYGGTDVIKTWTPPRDTERPGNGALPWNNENPNQSDQTRSYIEDNPGEHGVYYNWNAATAGQGNSGFVALQNEEKRSETSICPSGWTLPEKNIDGKSSYSSMKAFYPDPFNDAPQLKKSGYYSMSGGVLTSIGVSTYYWTNTTIKDYNEGRISALTFTGRDNYSNQPRGYGFNIRCVMKYEEKTFGGITNMQEMTTEICDAETTPYAFLNGASSGDILANTTRKHSTSRNLVPEAELTDTRDNKQYIVRKLADGKCWMVQSLDLDLNFRTTLTNQDTDLNSKTSWKPQYSTQPSGTLVPWGNNFQASSAANSYDPGDIYYSGTLNPQTSSSSGELTSHVGNYYNWYAATAGSGVYNISSEHTNVQDSICPKGWRLPTNGNNSGYPNGGEFRGLTNKYGITTGTDQVAPEDDSKLVSKPLSFIRAGFYFSAEITGAGSTGVYASSTNASLEYIWAMSFYHNYASPWGMKKKGEGLQIRCLVR